MKEGSKNKIILVLALLTLIFFIFLVSTYQDLAKQKGLTDQEIRIRMNLEEEIMGLLKQNENLEKKVGFLQGQLNVEKLTYQEEIEILNQKILELEGQLQTIGKLKEKL